MYIYTPIHIYLVVGRLLDALQGAQRQCHAGDDMIYVYIYTHIYIYLVVGRLLDALQG